MMRLRQGGTLSAPHEALRALDILRGELCVRVRDGRGAVLPGLQLEQPGLRALMLCLQCHDRNKGSEKH